MKSKSYEEFVEKFKPKKTTDDCYTPPEKAAAERWELSEREKEMVKMLGTAEE